MLPLSEKSVSEEKIVELVDAFYAKVRQDDVLGPVFENAIAPEAWPAHLAKMYDFWSSVMLTTGRYKGNPMMAHMQVAGIEESLFPRWLALFAATADEVCSPAIAAIFRLKSERIAESLKLGLFYLRSREGLAIRPQ